ncbi:hypothetical protein ZWY2020_028806 [Hordeum vulgare]|nr:hypothetical protein ZWY2020_028806 [Hordeum vulgare]
MRMKGKTPSELSFDYALGLLCSIAMEAKKPGFRKAEKHSKNALRSVSELHIGDEKRVGSRKFHMDKVFERFELVVLQSFRDTNIQAVMYL